MRAASTCRRTQPPADPRTRSESVTRPDDASAADMVLACGRSSGWMAGGKRASFSHAMPGNGSSIQRSQREVAQVHDGAVPARLPFGRQDLLCQKQLGRRARRRLRGTDVVCDAAQHHLLGALSAYLRHRPTGEVRRPQLSVVAANGPRRLMLVPRRSVHDEGERRGLVCVPGQSGECLGYDALRATILWRDTVEIEEVVRAADLARRQVEVPRARGVAPRRLLLNGSNPCVNAVDPPGEGDQRVTDYPPGTVSGDRADRLAGLSNLRHQLADVFQVATATEH